MAVYLPGYTFRDLGPDGGPFDQTNNVKVVLHTTQGSSLAGAESAYRNYPPHLGYDPALRIKRQYVRLDRHSYALRNSEAEDDYVIQVEIVGFAESTHKWTDATYRNIAVDVVEPLTRALNVPRRHLRFYRAGENGYVLASKYSPIRLSNAEWRAYSGWVGHQHSPAPDEHWDPGGFLMDKVFSYIPEDDDVSAIEVWGYKNPSLDSVDMRAYLVYAHNAAKEAANHSLIIRRELGGADWQAVPDKVAALEGRLGTIEAKLNEILNALP